MNSPLRFIAGFALLTLAAQAHAAVNTNADGVALEGRDPVAFFTQAAPMLGKAEISAEHEGATYYFARQTHRDQFLADPERYVPAFGGYCAFGAAKGKLFPVEIETWQIVDERLLLNYNDEIKAQFDADVEALLAKADENWPGLK